MRFQQPRPKNDDERILPLINVVFLLLIFFMLTGKLAATDPFKVNPPESISTAQAKEEVLLVSLSKEGRLALDHEEIEEAYLVDTVMARISDLDDDVEVRVRLKADSDAEAVQVVKIMKLLQEAGIDRLFLLTIPGES